jgi:hypothetical protein
MMAGGRAGGPMERRTGSAPAALASLMQGAAHAPSPAYIHSSARTHLSLSGSRAARSACWVCKVPQSKDSHSKSPLDQSLRVEGESVSWRGWETVATHHRCRLSC